MNKIKKALCFVLTLALLPIGALLVGCGKNPTLALDSSDAQTYFKVGDDFSSDGLVVEYNDKEVDDYEIDSSNFDKTKPGEYIINVEYEDLEKSYKVYVVTLLVETTNAKTTFVVGDTFSSAGIVVKATIKEEKVLSAEEYVVDTTAIDMQTAGSQSVKIKYNGVEVSYQIEVIDEIGGILLSAKAKADDVLSVVQNTEFVMSSGEGDEAFSMEILAESVCCGNQNYAKVTSTTAMTGFSMVIESEAWQTEGEYMKQKSTMFGMTSYSEFTDTIEDFEGVEDVVEKMFKFVTLEGVEDLSYQVSEGVLTISYTIPENIEEEMLECVMIVTVDLEAEFITKIQITSALFSEDLTTPTTIVTELKTETTEIPELPTGVVWEEDLYHEEMV